MKGQKLTQGVVGFLLLYLLRQGHLLNPKHANSASLVRQLAPGTPSPPPGTGMTGGECQGSELSLLLTLAWQMLYPLDHSTAWAQT